MAQAPSVVWCQLAPEQPKPVPVSLDGHLDFRWTRLQPATVEVCGVVGLVTDAGRSEHSAAAIQQLLQSLGLNTGATQDAPLVLSGDPIAAGAAAGAAAGVPLFENVILHVTGDANNPEEFVRTYARVSRATLQKVLDGLGCDVVQDPATKELVSFDAIELHDNMLLTALRFCVPWEARVSTLEGFVESSVKGFEVDATEALYSDLQRRHSSVKVLPIGAITNTNGKKREVDGAVIADGCAAILEAKQVLDNTAVPQLASCLDFIRDSELMGPAAELKGKKLLGFLAGRTLSNDPGKVQKLVRDCRQHGYGIYVSSGRSMQLGNSRVPHLPVDCTMYKRSCGASSCLVRVA